MTGADWNLKHFTPPQKDEISLNSGTFYVRSFKLRFHTENIDSKKSLGVSLKQPDAKKVLRLGNRTTDEKITSLSMFCDFSTRRFTKKTPRLIVLVLKTPRSFCVESGP